MTGPSSILEGAHGFYAAYAGDAEAPARLRNHLGTLGERWQAPRFPLKGSDLVALGTAEGPALGALLRTLESEWVAEGFTADRELLLARARERAR